MTDPRGNTTVFRVDGADRQTETIDAKGVRVSRVVYNDNDLRDEVRIAPPEGVTSDADGLIRSRRFGYNPRNELKTATDFFGRFVTSFHDANSTVVRVVDEKGVPREFVPDELDRTMEERVQIRPGTVAITAFHYDARGNRDRVTDPRGQVYFFDHDAASRLFRLTYPAIVTGPQPGASHVETWTYNNHGEPATHTDALGNQATFGYDAMGRSTTETHMLGAALRAALTRAYDGASNLVSAFDAVTGLAVEYQTPLGTPGYDALNRLTDVRFRVGGVIFKSLHYGYDAASNRETMTGPDGETIACRHDPNNRLETLRRNGALFGTWVYDSGGRLKETQLGNGAVARRTYDGKEQVRSVRTQTSGGALLAGYAYDYNERGERTQMIAEHLGTTAAYGYTDNSWLSSEIYSGSITSTRSYEYDLGGNRNRAIRDGVACSYFHDEENRLFREVCQLGAGGQFFGTPVASSTKPGHSAAVLADGDTTDSPSAKKSWRNDEKTPGLIFAGLDFGAVKTISEIRFFIPTLEGNEGAAGMQRFNIQVGDGTTFTDAVPTALQGAEPSPTPGLALRSAEREGGWLRTVKPTQHEVRVQFVPLTGKVVRILMDLGPSDQPKTMRLNEIQAFGPAEEVIQYFYDANGNQTKRAKGSIEETLAYDYRNLLANYTRKNTSTSAIESAFMYAFMPTGERLSKMDVLSGQTTWSMYDGADVVSDYTTTPTAPLFALSASYVNALGIDSKVAHINPNGDRFFYTTDALGSATQLVNASQAVVNNYFTTAWGEDLINQRSVADRYGFTQRERDDESSLMHFRARSYDPRTGRFVQKEPLLRNRVLMHYMYASANPLMFVDPTGQLQRRQFDWLAYKFVKDWKGVGPAKANDLTAAMKTIRTELRKLVPDAFKGDEWVDAVDDPSLQRFIDGKQGKDKDWAGFPGTVYSEPIFDLQKMLEFINEARKLVPGEKISTELLMSWVMYESTWRTDAGAYGWSSTKGSGKVSTAVGLLQITQSTYESPEMARQRSKGLPDKWDEEELTRPGIGIAAGMHVLLRKPAQAIRDKLVLFKGAGGAAYADAILGGELLLKDYVEKLNAGKKEKDPKVTLESLSQQQGAELIGQLREKLGR